MQSHAQAPAGRAHGLSPLRPVSDPSRAVKAGVTCEVVLASHEFPLPHDDGTTSRLNPSSEGEAEVRFDHFFELSLDLMAVAGFDGYFKHVNPMWMSTLGWTLEEFLTTPSVEFVHPEDRAVTLAARSRLTDGVPLRGLVNRYRCKDGSYRWFEWQSVSYCDRRLVYAVARDITQRRELEQEQQRVQARLTAAERQASIGRLAAGAAHEINNPLAFIMANLRAALEEVRAQRGGSPLATAELEEMLSDSLDGAERVRTIVRGLSSFSRMEAQRRAPIELEPVMEHSLGGVAQELRRCARLCVEYGETPRVEADAVRLGEVFTHLLVNAAQSIPEGDPEANEVRIVTSTDAAGRAVVEIHDTGSGMSPETLSRIFDPFFTTRAVGEGTGLGLSICHNSVASLGGQLTASSEEGRGSIFRLVLPAASSGQG
jgi:PAS domain S-box-containing protein